MAEQVGESGAARGRLAVTTAQTPDGPLRVVGVCIPWRDAHVSTGRGDAQAWSEHLAYLDRLADLLAGLGEDVPTVIAGDFNQRIPRGHQPVRVADRLLDVLAGWSIHTAGALPNGPHIDHIATNQRLVVKSTSDWAGSDHVGRLSDHGGVACLLAYAETSVPAGDMGLATERGGGDRERDRLLVSGDAPASSGGQTKDRVPTPANPPSADGALDPELRAEIEDILRRSSDGLSHGATFRLREQGLSDEEIADERKVSVSATRVFLRSLDALLTGTLPTTKSLALTNSYVYRELLNHPLSIELDSYANAQLRKLKVINPEVSLAPLQTRSHQYGVGKRTKPKERKGNCGQHN